MSQSPQEPNAIGTMVPAFGAGPGSGGAGIAGTQEFKAGDAILPASVLTPTLLGRNNHPVLAYPSTASTVAYFPSTMARDWGGSSVTLQIYWLQATAPVVGSVEWTVQWERDNPGPFGVNIDVDSFAGIKTVTTSVPATLGFTVVSSIIFSAAEADFLTPGDPYRFLIRRVGGAGGDTMAGDAQIHRVSVGGPT